MTQEQFLKLFPRSKIIGKAFPVFELEGKEFALARTEKKVDKGHKGFEVITKKQITIEEDLKRRDITINSIAQKVLTKELIDPYKGIRDLQNGIIKATSKAFLEDPLRVYRVARFAAQLDFKVEEDTIKLINSLKEELKYLSKERVFVEFKKALNTQKPSIFFDVLRKSQLLQVHFKPVYDLIGALQPEKYHPEGDAYNHTMLCLDNSVLFTKELEVRYSVLVHDFGKGTTRKEEYPHHYGHETRGADIVKKFSKDMCVPKAWERCGITSCLEHMRGGIFYKMKPSKKVDFIERVNKSYLGLHGLQVVVNCDKMRNNSIQDEQYQFEKVGKMCLEQVNANKVSKKYGIEEGIRLGNKIHEERINWIKGFFDNFNY